MKRIILTILALLSLPSCSNLTPEGNALLVDTAAKVIDVGLDRLNTKHPQK